MRRPVRLLVAALLAYAGVLAILYGPIAPLVPPVVDRPVPAVAFALGLAHLGVALGLVRSWRLARPAAVALVLLDAVMQSVVAGGIVLEASPAASWPYVLFGLGELAVDAAVLWVLTLGWREPATG